MQENSIMDHEYYNKISSFSNGTKYEDIVNRCLLNYNKKILLSALKGLKEKDVILKTIHKKILLINHENNFTGAPILLIEFCKIFGVCNDIDIFHLYNTRNIHFENAKILSDVKLSDFDNYDIVIINTISPRTLDFLKHVNYLYKENTILWIHELDINCYNELEKLGCMFKFVLCDSQIVLDTAKSLLPKISSNIFLHNLANISEIKTQEFVKKEKDNCLNFGNFGTICQRKNQIQIIEALKICKDKGYHNIKLFLLKTCDDELIGKISEYNLADNICFVDEVQYDKVDLLYNNIDVYISSSINEPFGKTLIESMEKGIPILGYNSGNNVNMIEHAFNGFIYNDENELSKYIIYYYNNRDKLSDMSENSFILHKLKNTSRNQYIERTDNFLHSLTI